MTRLFIALKIPSHVKRKILNYIKEIQSEDSDFSEKNYLKWESEDKIHLTLKFIGEVENNLVKKISDEINFIEKYDKFICRFTGFDFFFKNREPKILWLGLSTDDRIKELAYRLNDTLEKKFSVPAEKREFKSHLTLLRIRKKIDDSFIKKFKEFKIPAEEFIADEAALIKSQLLPAGSKHTEINNYKLK